MGATEARGSGGPLRGVRVLEIGGIGPCPFAGMVLADLGADVVRVDRPAVSEAPERSAEDPTLRRSGDLHRRGKRSLVVDLKKEAGVALVARLAGRADVLLEGFRPGVAERLGVGPEPCLSANPRLVYVRVTGFGQNGPLAGTPGHDIDYIALSGVLGLIGREDEAPVPPLNLVGDFGGGGMLAALGAVAGLFEVARGGAGQVVDAAMVDGSALLSVMVWSLRAAGLWHDRRGVNLLDTGAPFYEVYECADGGHVAVGALEPKFYSALCRLAGLEEDDLPAPTDRGAWPVAKRRFAAAFASRTREEWLALAAADGGESCLAPVLSLDEAARHPHNAARETFVDVAGVAQPAPAPRFTRTPCAPPLPPCGLGEGGGRALSAWGLSADEVAALLASGAIQVWDGKGGEGAAEG